MANLFRVFDENSERILSDAEYAANQQRVAGVAPGIADPSMHNKLFRQVSIMAAAIAEVVSQYITEDITDEDFTVLVAQIKATLAEPGKNAIPKTQRAAANGVATLDANTKVVQTAKSADKLSTGRKIKLTGGVAGESTPFTGEEDVTITVEDVNAKTLNGKEPSYYATVAGLDAASAVAADGVSRAKAAQTTADAAKTDAATAQTTANTAVTNAATAQTRANLGVTNAATAQATADTAKTAAATAQSTANTAVTNAAAAQTRANLGVTNAAAAQTTANTALTNAATAQTTANGRLRLRVASATPGAAYQDGTYIWVKI